MTEIVRIVLENELDLIMSHKRAMKIAELCGMASHLQTRFATAVSEVARCAISHGERSRLSFGIEALPGGKKEILAVVADRMDLEACNPEPFAYARRLSRNITKSVDNGEYRTLIAVPIQFPGTITEARLSYLSEYFRSEAPLSPYDEIRKKNIQLIELSERLTESENGYRQLTDTLPLGVLSISSSGKVRVANKRAEELFGKNFENFTASSLSAVLHDGDFLAVSQGWEVARQQGSYFERQVRLMAEGQYRWYLLQVVPSKEQHGHADQWIVSVVDIHAQKLIEETLKDNKELRAVQESLRTSNEELQRRNRELEQFAYVASHDLQEPLRKIRNFISMAEKSIRPEQKKMLYMDKIEGAAERMSLLIRDILNYSTLSVKANFEPTDLTTVVAEVLQDLELQIAERGASVEVAQLPEVDAITAQMGQFFYNMIGNALKFCEGAPHVRIGYDLVTSDTAGQRLAPGTYHAVSVTDNGIGIDERYQAKIFSIFQRLHPQTDYQGTGIGLALCMRIAENHEGALTVSSQPGEGSVFTLYLPFG